MHDNMWHTEHYEPEELAEVMSRKNEVKNEVRCLTEFTIQPYHISLLSRMTFSFGDEYDYCYEGFFCSDDKRPFGNKSWMLDVATEMLHELPDDESYIMWCKQNYLKYYRVFQEMQLVLNIVAKYAVHGGIEVGKVYTRKHEYATQWNLKDAH